MTDEQRPADDQTGKCTGCGFTLEEMTDAQAKRACPGNSIGAPHTFARRSASASTDTGKLFIVVRETSARYMGAYEWVRTQRQAAHFISRKAAEDAAVVARRSNSGVEVVVASTRDSASASSIEDQREAIERAHAEGYDEGKLAAHRTGSALRIGPVDTLDLLALRDRMNAHGQLHVATGDGVTETRLEIIDMKAAAEARESSPNKSADQDVRRLTAIIKTAVLAAVHDGRPCPFCLAPTTNVWPFCEHIAICAAKDVAQLSPDAMPCAGSDSETPAVSARSSPKEASDPPANLVADELTAEAERLGMYQRTSDAPYTEADLDRDLEALKAKQRDEHLRGLCDNLEARAEKAEALYRSCAAQLGAIAEALGNAHGDPEVSLGMIDELKVRPGFADLHHVASRANRAWHDDPTSIYTENAMRELHLQLLSEQGSGEAILRKRRLGDFMQRSAARQKEAERLGMYQRPSDAGPLTLCARCGHAAKHHDARPGGDGCLHAPDGPVGEGPDGYCDCSIFLAPRPGDDPPRCSNDDRYDPKDGPVLVQVSYFKRSGKWYCDDENVEWHPDPDHYTGWKPLSEIHRIRDMFAVCMQTPLGFPQFSRPQVAEEAAEQRSERNRP